jgi:RES domain-containing protein
MPHDTDRPATATATATATTLHLESIHEGSGLAWRDVAQLLGAPPHVVSRWRAGLTSPCARDIEQILLLGWAVEQLTRFYVVSDVGRWLFSQSPTPGGLRPSDLLAERRVDEVVELIDLLDAAPYTCAQDPPPPGPSSAMTLFDPELLDALEACTLPVVSDTVWRQTLGQRAILRSSRHAARWNPAGLETLYCALDPLTASAELNNTLRLQSIPPSRVRTTAAIDISLWLVADLRSREWMYDGSGHWDATDPSPCATLGAAAARIGCEGLIAPSRHADGDILVIFVDNVDEATSLEVVSSSQEQILTPPVEVKRPNLTAVDPTNPRDTAGGHSAGAVAGRASPQTSGIEASANCDRLNLRGR